MFRRSWGPAWRYSSEVHGLGRPRWIVAARSRCARGLSSAAEPLLSGLFRAVENCADLGPRDAGCSCGFDGLSDQSVGGVDHCDCGVQTVSPREVCAGVPVGAVLDLVQAVAEVVGEEAHVVNYTLTN